MKMSNANLKYPNWPNSEIARYVRKNKKGMISSRTIERCIASDPRISKNGWYYFIDDKARFEKRYSNPKDQIFLFWNFIDGRKNPLEGDWGKYNEIEVLNSMEQHVRDMVTVFGGFLVFTFLEATKPFKDDSLSPEERNDLVDYWVQNSIPLTEMLSYFTETLRQYEWAFDRVVDRRSDPWRPYREIDESIVTKVFMIMKRNYADLYSGLKKPRKSTKN